MTTAEMIVVIVLAVAAWILVLVMCYRLDVAHQRIARLREENTDLRSAVERSNEIFDRYASICTQLREENAKLRRSLQPPDSMHEAFDQIFRRGKYHDEY